MSVWGYFYLWIPNVKTRKDIHPFFSSSFFSHYPGESSPWFSDKCLPDCTYNYILFATYFLLFLSPPGRDKGITQSLRISGPWLHSDILSSDNLVIFRLLAIFETTRLVYYIYFQVVCRYYCSITSKKSRKLFGKVFDYYRILHLIFYWMIRKLKQRINLFLKPMIHYYANFMYWIRKQTLKVK